MVSGLHRGITLRFLDSAIAVSRLDADRDHGWTRKGKSQGVGLTRRICEVHYRQPGGATKLHPPSPTHVALT
jgi:hypothetical protein